MSFSSVENGDVKTFRRRTHSIVKLRVKPAQFSIRTLLILVGVSAICVAGLLVLFPKAPDTFSSDGYLLDANDISSTWPQTPLGEALPPCSVYWFRNDKGQVVAAFAAFGESRPQIMVSDQQGDIEVPSLGSPRIKIPQDKSLYILGPELKLHKTRVAAGDVAEGWQNYKNWSQSIVSEIKEHGWR